ncbi:MAG: hypothetical protein GF308_09985 [Candidatus Heimdallarchaeota archaeon]|nr:hypothetical protein [Candidatus Heimdallarchaeota archaeon]
MEIKVKTAPTIVCKVIIKDLGKKLGLESPAVISLSKKQILSEEEYKESVKIITKRYGDYLFVVPKEAVKVIITFLEEWS